MHNFRKGETLWRKKKDKTLYDIEFLKICYNSNITPKLLCIKVYKHHLQRIPLVRNLQRKHLDAELQSKGDNLKELQNKLTNALTTL